MTTSLAAGHRRLMLPLPVIKPSPPCCCVKHHLNCQLGSGGGGDSVGAEVLGFVSSLSLLSISPPRPRSASGLLSRRRGRLNFSWLQSARSSLLVGRNLTAALMLAICPKCRPAKAQLSASVQDARADFWSCRSSGVNPLFVRLAVPP